MASPPLKGYAPPRHLPFQPRVHPKKREVLFRGRRACLTTVLAVNLAMSECCFSLSFIVVPSHTDSNSSAAHLMGSNFRRRRLAGPQPSQVFEGPSPYSGVGYPPFAYGPAPPYPPNVSVPRVPFNLNTRGRGDMAASPLGLSPLSATSSSRLSMSSSPSPLYRQPLVMSYPVLNLDSLDFNQLQYPQGVESSSKWAPDVSFAQSGVPQFTYTPATAPKVEGYNAEYEADVLNISSPPPSNDSSSAPSPDALSAYESATTMSNGQWNNTSIVINSGPDPIEPFFRTLKERELVSRSLPYFPRIGKTKRYQSRSLLFRPSPFQALSVGCCR